MFHHKEKNKPSLAEAVTIVKEQDARMKEVCMHWYRKGWNDALTSEKSLDEMIHQEKAKLSSKLENGIQQVLSK